MHVYLKRYWLKQNIKTFFDFLDEDEMHQELARVDAMTEAELDEMAEAITKAIESEDEDDL